MVKVYVLEVRDQWLTCTRYPVAVCVSEALARQAAERHFAQRERQALAEWTRWRRSPSLLSRGWEAAEQVVHRW